METNDLASWMSDRPGLFPLLYTLASFALFGAPIVAGLSLAMDPSISYWIGWRAWAILLVPALLLLAHLAHENAQRLMIPGIAMSTIIPAIVLLVVGYDQQVNVSNLVWRMASGVATLQEREHHWEAHMALQKAHTAAESLFDECVLLLAGDARQHEAQLRAVLTLQDCPAYLMDLPPGQRRSSLLERLQAERLQWAAEWGYLESLERTEGCAGWSTEGKQTLWVAEWPRAGDPCFVAARFVMESHLRVTLRLMVLGLAYLILTFLVVINVQRAVRYLADGVKFLQQYEGF